METIITYTIESINRPYGAQDSIPWGDAHRAEGLTERKAVRRYNEMVRWYHPDGPNGGYSGHVRIVGSDDWTYEVERPPRGQRATLCPMYHLDDL
jgi:hypothetical protein